MLSLKRELSGNVHRRPLAATIYDHVLRWRNMGFEQRRGHQYTAKLFCLTRTASAMRVLLITKA